jgi:serine/threonine protein kinase
MAESFIDNFLSEFNDDQYPADFLVDYEPMECLAHNEFGETLLVKDRQTDSYYVAKCYTNLALIPRISESSLLENLQHTGLPVLIGEYQNDKMLCVVRGYAKGKPLDKLVRDKPLNLKQSLNILLQLCDILTYLHSQDPPIIHRDIKPQNIIVDDHGRVTLIDFGISRAYNEDAREDTICFGTRKYAAPEQYGFAQTDPRADIFSVGVLIGWLLTGKTDVEQAKKAIPNRRLRGILEKCTAFDPKKRYKSAAQVKNALTGHPRLRRSLAIIGSILILTASLLYFKASAGIRFKEPLIEEAVRLSLGLDANIPLTEEDLLSVDGIYVFGSHAVAENEDLNEFVDDFANGGGSQVRGDIDNLQDIKKLKNIRWITLGYQNISDLSPLENLASLETLDLCNNPMLDDFSPLSGLGSLTSLVIFDTGVSDLSVLRDCPRLTLVDIGGTQITSLAALDGLDALQTLVIRKAPLRTLEGIEEHPLLEEIFLSQTLVTDFSPLLSLPRLQRVEVSQNMRSDMEATIEEARFEIIYQ